MITNTVYTQMQLSTPVSGVARGGRAEGNGLDLAQGCNAGGTVFTVLDIDSPVGVFSFPTGVITAHQLYNYITDHAGTYNMKPLRMSKSALSDGRKGTANAELHEYALVALWNR